MGEKWPRILPKVTTSTSLLGIWNLLFDNILRTMMEINWRIQTSVRRCLLAPLQVIQGEHKNTP
jgi:hypothetical protein